MTSLTRLLVPFFLAAPLGAQDLLVSSRNSDQILRYDGTTGSFVGVFASGGGLDNPVGLTFGPDGNLYVANDVTDQVLRYDGTTGAFLGVFASGGGLDAPRQVNFGPDGNLYVASGATNQILRYDGTTGAFLDVFASGGSVNGPTSFTFAPDGDLYVGSVLNDRVKHFDGTSGAFIGNFIIGINGPHDLAFAPDGFVLVTAAFTSRISRHDPVTGVKLGDLVVDAALSAPLGMVFDGVGNLYVANQGTDEVRRYDVATGSFLGSFVSAGSGGLDGPLFLTFMPQSGLAIGAPYPGVAGAVNTLLVSGARPGEFLTLRFGQRKLFLVLPDCIRPRPLLDSFLVLPVVADEGGRAALSWPVPAALAGRTLYLQVLGSDPCQSNRIRRWTF